MITIVDYGMGNLRSVEKAFGRLAAEVEITNDPDRVAKAEKLLLPGVGHFKRGMENLNSSGLLDAVQMAKGRGIPLLGICLGMQLLAKSSEESGGSGLGFINADVVEFSVDDTVKVPHMGWNSLAIQKSIPLLKGVEENESFYFAHSFHYDRFMPEEHLVALTEYAFAFPCIVQNENVIGVQFHPEKSHDAGLLLLRNFMDEY